MKHVFISYSRRDTRMVDQLVVGLRNAGYEVWIDRVGILGARLWSEEIVVAIREAQAFLVALSPNSAASKNVRKELDLGGQYERPVIPVRIAETEIPDEMQYQLAGIQHIDGTSLEQGLLEVRSVLESLGVDRADAPTKGPESAESKVRWPRGAPLVYGLSVLPVALISSFSSKPATSDLASSLGGLLPTWLFDGGVVGLASIGLLGAAGLFGALVWRELHRHPVAMGLFLFLLLTVPWALWQGQHLAALFGAIAACAVGAWWWRGGRASRPAPIIAQVFLMLAATGIGVGLQGLPSEKPGSRATIVVTPLDVPDDEELLSKQRFHSKELLDNQYLSLVEQTGLFDVQPDDFTEDTLGDWLYQNWRGESALQIRPNLVLRNSLGRCKFEASENGEQLVNFTWLSQPYSWGSRPQTLRPVWASGPDPDVLSVGVAFRLMKSSREYEVDLNAEQLQELKRYIVDDARHIALDKGLYELRDAADHLLAKPMIQDEQFDAFLDDFLAEFDATDGGPCDKVARINQNAQKGRVTSYSNTPASLPPRSSRTP